MSEKSDARPTSLSDEDKRRLWSTFADAIGAELREGQTIKGVSGLDHPAQAIAADDKNRRIIIVSAEQNARVSALMQGDVQATMPDVKVLVARPVAVDLASIARQYFPVTKGATVNVADLMSRLALFNGMDEASKSRVTNEFLEKHLKNPLAALKYATLPTFVQIVDLVYQATYLDWSQILASVKDGDGVISLERLLEFDSTAVDRKHGVCPIPMYEFKETDWELLFKGNRVDEVRARLQDMGIYQYFFPAPDQLAVGLADNGVSSPTDIMATVNDAPSLGHPLGDTEIVPSTTKLPDLLDQLKEQGYVAEGEYGIEVSEAGRVSRATLKFRPREGLISKLINRFTLNANVNASINPKDFT